MFFLGCATHNIEGRTSHSDRFNFAKFCDGFAMVKDRLAKIEGHGSGSQGSEHEVLSLGLPPDTLGTDILDKLQTFLKVNGQNHKVKDIYVMTDPSTYAVLVFDSLAWKRGFEYASIGYLGRRRGSRKASG